MRLAHVGAQRFNKRNALDASLKRDFQPRQGAFMEDASALTPPPKSRSLRAVPVRSRKAGRPFVRCNTKIDAANVCLIVAAVKSLSHSPTRPFPHPGANLSGSAR